MASYGFNLYFSKSVSREEMRRRITALAGCKPVSDQPETYCFEYVHLRLSTVAQENAVREIQQTTGLEIGDYHVDVSVYTSADEAFQEKWDRALDLLNGGEDAIAVQEFEWILLTQHNGQLTLDSSGEMLSPYYRDYILSKRPAQLKALGILE